MPTELGAAKAPLGPDMAGQQNVGSPYGSPMVGRQMPSLTNVLMAASMMSDRQKQQSLSGIKHPNRGSKSKSLVSRG